MRIKFYSANDLSSSWFLQAIELYFQNWDQNLNQVNINTILELYNIQLYIQVGKRLPQWSNNLFAEYKEKCKEISGIIGRFFSNISDQNLIDYLSLVDRAYKADFWELFSRLKTYKRISSQVMETVLKSNGEQAWFILRHRDLVEQYDDSLSKSLETSPYVGEKLIVYYLTLNDLQDKPVFFPKSFTQKARSSALEKYVEGDRANIKLLQLLEQAKAIDGFPVSYKLKNKARLKRIALQDQLFARGTGITWKNQVEFRALGDFAYKKSFQDDGMSILYTYNIGWLQENRDYPTLLNNFIYLFEYVDRCFRSNFPVKESSIAAFEKLFGYKGNNDYMVSAAFLTESNLSMLQMLGYEAELKRMDIRVEELFQWFFETYLAQEFGAKGFTYTPPSQGTTYGEKCKLLASAIDGAMRQYKLFCEEGRVDRALLEMTSDHVFFKDLRSLVSPKYAYANSNEFQTEMNLLLSNQSIFSYSEKTGHDYDTLIQRLHFEHPRLEDFPSYETAAIKWLIERKAIYIGMDNRIQINLSRATILKDLFEYGVICPNYYCKELQSELEELVSKGEMIYEDTLLSWPEQAYLNYVLNKAQYSNGLDLRNKYIHDSCTVDEATQRTDYMEFLKIMVLLIIKINEEFCLKDELSKTETATRPDV